MIGGILLKEWIRGEQAVGADMPTRQWTKTFRMTHDGNANGLAIVAAGGVVYVLTTVWDAAPNDGRQDVFLDVLSCKD